MAAECFHVLMPFGKSLYAEGFTKKQGGIFVNNSSKNKKYGVILRTFATKEEDVEKRVKMVGETVKKIEAVEIDGQKIFSRVDILVWKNERFPDCDCGQTAIALAEALAEFPVVEIEEVKNFDLFCGILNYGIGKHLLKGISHSLIMSPDANSYLTPETINEIIKRFDEIGTMAVGLAITELTQSIKEGRLANTFLMWNNLSFVTIGGFDFFAKKLTPQEEEKFKAIGIKRIQGVEEVIPLARLSSVHVLPLLFPKVVGSIYSPQIPIYWRGI